VNGQFEWFIPQSLGPNQKNRLEIKSAYTAAQSPSFAIGMLNALPFHSKVIRK
jgi:hypothetical protein